MRLSDFENEDALDLLAKIIEPAAEIMSDPQIVNKFRTKPPIFGVADILKNHKKAAIEIVAALHGKTPDSFRFNIATLTNDVLDMVNDPEMRAVFTSQSQQKTETSSGSAMESTEEKEM